MAKMKIDELNILGASDDEAFDYNEFIDHYFDTMQISKKQKKQRIEAAKEIMDIILYFLIWCDEFPEKVDDEIMHDFENDYKEKLFTFTEPDDYFAEYVPFFIKNLVDVSLEHKGEKYYSSVERAANVAVNESNLAFGHIEMQQAVDAGYTHKTWRTERDNRVRPTHRDVEGWTIPIDQPFLVGNSLMMFPKDQSLGADPEEVVNCRCVCSFSKKEV